MYSTIYRPKKIEDFIGNKVNIQQLIRWLLEWNSDDQKSKCALISGLCGIGKSLLVDLVLKKHDYNQIDVALDDDRDKEFMNNVIKPLIKTKKTFDGQENVLVVSDIDSGSDYGFISSLTECIRDSKIPIICICNNRYDLSIKPVLNYCFDIKMTKPTYQEVYKLVYNVVITEKIRIKESQIKNLYEQSNGDIRFILNTLEFGLGKGKKDIQSSNIFETTSKLLSVDESIDSKYETYWLSNDLHILMIQENYINNTFGVRDEAKKLENISYSSDALSDADLFETKVNMTNWEFEPNVGLSVIMAASKCNKKMMIKFPQFLGRIATINKNKREKQNYDVINILKNKKNVSKKVEIKSEVKRGRPKKAK